MDLSSPESLSFPHFLREIVGAGAARGSTLTDGRLVLPYEALGERLEALEAFLASRGVGRGSPVALECVNSVPGALVLLYLLSRGFSFALLPAPGKAPPQPLPRLLRYRLTVRGTPGEGRDSNLERPDSFLEVAELPGFREPPEALASGRLLLRTSGSLGTPKLVSHTHARLLGNALNCVERLRLVGEDRIAIPVPLAHMYGLGAAFLPGLAVGASLDLQEGANVLRYPERERQLHPTVAFLTPALCTMLSRRLGAPARPYRHVVVAGDKLKPEAFAEAEARFRRVVNLYGSTELGVIAATDAMNGEEPRALTVGRPVPGVALRLEPREDGGQAEEGVGELWCHHPHGFEGYVDVDGQPVVSDPPPRDGWFCMKDLGRMHEGGLLEILGRSDHTVNRDGRLVMLAELERAVEQLPGVERAAAVLEGESQRGRRILVFCTPRTGSTLEGPQVRATCFDHLPSYAVPDEVRILDGLPLLPSGKLDRRALLLMATGAQPPQHSTSTSHQEGTRA